MSREEKTEMQEDKQTVKKGARTIDWIRMILGIICI